MMATARLLHQTRAACSHTADRAGRLWTNFWYAEDSTLGLGLFRVLFGICLYLEVETTRGRSVNAIDGGLRFPYLNWVPLVSEDTYNLIHNIQYPLIVLLALGVLARPACLSLLVLQGYIFFADQLNFRNHPYFFLLVLLILLPAPMDDALSGQAWARALRTRKPVIVEMAGSRQPLVFQRLIQIQVCIVYFYAALHKLNSAYLSGQVLSYHLSESLPRELNRLIGGWLSVEMLYAVDDFLRNPTNLILPSILSVALELSLPIGLMWSRTRTLAILFGSLFHITIGVTMNITVFSGAMLGCYLLFIPPDRLLTAWNKIRRRPRHL